MNQLEWMVGGLVKRIDRLVALARRTTTGPLLLRLAVAVAGLAAVTAGYGPSLFTSSAAVVLAIAAVLPGLFPRGAWTTVMICLAVIGYLTTTSSGDSPVTLVRLITLSAAIYVAHSGAAFAAILPYDAVVSPGMFLPWVLRTGVVILLTAAVAVFVMALPALIGGPRVVIASIAGFVLMLGVAGYLLFLGQR